MSIIVNPDFLTSRFAGFNPEQTLELLTLFRAACKEAGSSASEQRMQQLVSILNLVRDQTQPPEVRQLALTLSTNNSRLKG